MIARVVTGKILSSKVEINCVTEFSGMKTKESIMKKSNNLFGTDQMNQINLCDHPISFYCNEINVLSSDAENFFKRIKKT